jgi:hypothetical protein
MSASGTRWVSGIAAVVIASAVAVAVHHRRRRATRFEDAAARLAERLRAVDLPRSEGARLPPVRPSLRVIITASGVDLDDAATVASWRRQDRDAVLEGLDEAWSAAMPLAWRGVVPIVQGDVPETARRGGAGGFLLPRLVERPSDVRRIEQRWSERAQEPFVDVATVYADRAVTCHALFPVLYTLGQGMWSTYHLVERTARGDGAVVIDAPRSGERVDELGLTVNIRPEGYTVTAVGGFVQPGCRTVGPAVMTLPAADAAFVRGDASALTECMRTIRTTWSEELRGHHDILVAPHGAVSYGGLMRALDAVRESATGACEASEDSPECLFPRVKLGVMRAP